MTSILKLSTRHPIAAKQYQCMICDAPIPCGEKHERMVYINHEALPGTSRLKCIRFHIRCPDYFVHGRGE